MKTTQPIFIHPNSARHRGFTLIELLICISIVIVLAAVVFVMTGKIRDNARQANALSTMRQISLANVSYYSENNGDLNTIRDSPGEKGPFEAKGGRWVADSFMGRMQPYLFSDIETTNQGLLHKQITASFGELLGTTNLRYMTGSIFDGVETTTDGSAVRTPIAINSEVRPKWGPQNPPTKVSSLGDPSSVLYLTFGRYYFKPEHIQTYKPLPPPGDKFPIYFLPNRKGIFSFLDGHVEMLSPPIDERRLGENPNK